MAYRASERRSQKSQATQPREPDTIPIMNLFLTIIPMLLFLVVISQTALVALNFNSNSGQGGSGTGGGDGDKKADNIEIFIMAHDQADAEIFKGFKIKEPGKANKEIRFTNGEFDFRGLNATLHEMKKQNPGFSKVSIVPYENVKYGALLRTIDICKSNEIMDVGISVRRTGYGEVGG
ncbi:MAG: hypothetical protein CVU48_00200 [Candidatus Cloacimonetes bacterium HGW-Cloacimonetes-1]|jgi:hypothetical protein|nr:MAG: hypothetical protein CVU48_00200 [Candidatus Cloacimonetes bacterium HGW-Cloacimonetes-1]